MLAMPTHAPLFTARTTSRGVVEGDFDPIGEVLLERVELAALRYVSRAHLVQFVERVRTVGCIAELSHGREVDSGLLTLAQVGHELGVVKRGPQRPTLPPCASRRMTTEPYPINYVPTQTRACLLPRACSSIVGGRASEPAALVADRRPLA